MKRILSFAMLAVSLSWPSYATDIDPKKHPGANLVRTINRHRHTFKDGENFVYADRDGTKLYAVVAGGKITGWKAKDRIGKDVPVTEMRSTGKCYECVEGPAGTRCHRVGCT